MHLSHTISLAVLLLATVAHGAESGKHLFILSGQSNMAGMDPDQSFTPTVTKQFGAGNVIVVKSAASGCPIRYWYRNWKPAPGWKAEKPEEDKWLQTKADYSGALIQKVSAAIRGEKIKTVTFIWMQGESDALQRHGEVYGESLRGLVEQMQADLGRSEINVVIGRISDFGVSRQMPHWLLVRKAQVEFAESSPRYAWVDTDDLNDGIVRDGHTIINDLHYSPEGYMLLGKRFAQKAIALITKSADKPDESTTTKPAKAEKPNILILLADDLGYGDVRCYNPQRGKIPTPNIDRLAADGMRFTDGHSAAAGCTPSRYSLLTGRYDWRSRMQRGVFGGLGGPPLIPPTRLTIAGLAKQNGYRTACIGKWHLGWSWPVDKTQWRWLSAKYDGYSEETYIAPTATAEHCGVWKAIFSRPIGGGPVALGFDYYFGVDAPNFLPFCFIENDRTVGLPSEFLPAQNFRKMELANGQGPAVKDWKLEEVLPALEARAGAYIAESARTHEPFLLYLALTSPHQPWAVTEPWRGRSGLSTYADWVMETDAVVGRLLDALDKSGAARNTLILFSSDNGYAPFGVAEMIRKGHYSSGPLRGYKAETYEGGHRVPFIVRWPAVVKPGTVCNQLVQQTDLMATMADLFRVRLPEDAGEDSFSFLPLLKGEDRAVRPHCVNHSGQGGYGIRCGDWKLILEADKNVGPQLFNLAEDLGERTNLATQFPARVAELRTLMATLVAHGRSTPGQKQKNDVEVRWLPKEQ